MNPLEEATPRTLTESITAYLDGLYAEQASSPPALLLSQARASIEHFERELAAERERCAKIASVHRPKRKKPLGKIDDEYLREIIVTEERGEEIAAYEIAAAVRALGNTDGGTQG